MHSAGGRFTFREDAHVTINDRLLHALARGSTFDRVERVIPLPVPAAGAEVSLTVPGGVIWHPLALTATLSTSAVAGNRSPSLTVDDGNTLVARLATPATLAPSLALIFSWVAGGASAAAGGGAQAVTVNLPDLSLAPGYRLRSATAALDPGDQWSALVLWVEELLELPRGVNEQVIAGREMFLDQTSAAARGIV